MKQIKQIFFGRRESDFKQKNQKKNQHERAYFSYCKQSYRRNEKNKQKQTLIKIYSSMYGLKMCQFWIGINVFIKKHGFYIKTCLTSLLIY